MNTDFSDRTDRLALKREREGHTALGRRTLATNGTQESTEGVARRPEGESQSTDRRIVDDSDE